MSAERIPQSATIRVPLQAYLVGTNTPATGKTIAITLSKNGAAYGNPSGGSTNAVEIGTGSYYVDLSTTDTGTVGPLFVLGTEGTIDNINAIYDVAVLGTPQTGDSYARIGAAGINLTAVSLANGSFVTATFGACDFTSTMKSSITSAVPTAAAIATAVGTTAMTESYPSLHAAPTRDQAMFSMMSYLFNKKRVGTTITTYQLDGTTTAFTFTIDSATNPTTQTRAS